MTAAAVPENNVTAIDPAAVAQAMDPASVAAHMPQAEGYVRVLDRFFGSADAMVLALLVAAALYLLVRLVQSWMVHRSINKSIEANSPHAAALIDKINKPWETTGPSEIPGDDRNGLVLIAIGMAIGGFGLIQGDEVGIRLALGAALFPLLVGAALLLRRHLLVKAIERERAAGHG